MEKLIHKVEMDRKVIGRELPDEVTLYAVDSEHFMLSVKPLEELEEKALAKVQVSVVRVADKYVFNLPEKIYNFYHLDENDYTVMVSEQNPDNIIVSL
ncbi:MAG: hypothetical protein ACE5GD_01765 [Candidatus Geothermarchaeales archaeon]